MEMSTLLDCIAEFKPGRVRSTVVNRPTATSKTSAASVSFFRRQDAEVLFHTIRSQQMIIEGMFPRVQWNRNRVAEEQEVPIPCSRVLLIAGYPEFVNKDWLTGFFGRKFVGQVDAFIDHGTVDDVTGPISRVEVRFGSWRCQAHFAAKAIDAELKGFIETEYGTDPCAV